MDQQGSGYRLVTLGEWRLEYDGQEIPVRARKTKALISFFAFSQAQNHPRRRMATLLWPNLNDTQALASLRQTLSEIRRLTKQYEPLFDAGHSEIQVEPGNLKLDVDNLLSEIKAGRTPPDLVNTVSNLPQLLVDFHAISEDYEAWVTEIRGDLQKRFTDGLLSLCESETLDPKIRLHVAQAAFQLDGFDESAARAIIQSYAALNKVSKAIAFYDELCEKFARDLDTEPSLTTQDLAAQIKLNLSAAVPAAPLGLSEPAPKLTGEPNRLENAIAVLPFQSLGPFSLPSYVQLGLLDEITCSLAGTISPPPISSNSMRRFLNQPPPSPADVGRETGARYVINGSIRSDGINAKVAVQMADTTTETVFWAEVYRSSMTDIMTLESPIAKRIVTSFVPSLHGVELGRTKNMSSDHLEPFQLVLRARELIFNLSPETFSQAGKLLRSAVKRGPNFAPAFAALADWHSVRIWQGWSADADEDQRELEAHALRAISLNPNDGRTMAFLGHNRLIFARKYEEAQGYFNTALSNMPGDSETLNWTVPGLTYIGHPNQAIENGERALVLSPFDPFRFRNKHFLSIAHYAEGNFDRAAELGLDSFDDNPTYLSNLRFTIASLFAAGQTPRARDLVTYHHEIEPEFHVSDLISRHPFRSKAKRSQYGQHLVDAGLNA